MVSKAGQAVQDGVQNLGTVDGKPSLILSAAVETQPAYARLAYLFREFLSITPSEMVRGYAAETLDSLVVTFHEMYAERHSLQSTNVREWFGPLLQTKATEGRSPLRKYFSPQHSISLWIQAVDRRVSAEIQRQEGQGLDIVFAQGEPWMTIAFTYTFLLKWTVNDVERKANRPLRDRQGDGNHGLVTELELDYQSGWGLTSGKRGGRNQDDNRIGRCEGVV